MVSNVRPIEIGSLSAVNPNESQFIGSSSGIFFVNTVRRAFAVSRAGSVSLQSGHDNQPHDPASIDNCIVGNESPISLPEHVTRAEQERQFPSYGTRSNIIGIPPPRNIAKELIMVYFRVWHPLFPFIHGPTFLQEVENLYSREGSPLGNNDTSRENTCRAIVFQCIFNIAAIDRPDLRLPKISRIESASGLLSCLGDLVSRHDIPCLQALLACQVYLAVTMSLQAASTAGGMLLKLIFHAGFHRCPCRYAQLSSHDCEIRKRIFWSAYVMDRYLSQALGLPLGIQDSDIDVCVPGTEELHRPASTFEAFESTPASNEVALHLPRGHPDLEPVSPPHQPVIEPRGPTYQTPNTYTQGTPLSASNIKSDGKRYGADALANYVAYGKLTGRALELFHKNIPVRSVDYSKILDLTSDVHTFWNALPQELQYIPRHQVTENVNSNKNPPHLGLFFTVIYQQLILLINRPFLSLDPSTPEFRSSLQTCIGASRSIIWTLREQTEIQSRVSWPGLLSATWMSGLILAFACALDLYPFTKGFPEIEMCLDLLEHMGDKRTTARHCHSALKVLLDDLRSQFGKNPISVHVQASRKRAQPLQDNHQNIATSPRSPDHGHPKRPRVDASEMSKIHDQILEGNIYDPLGARVAPQNDATQGYTEFSDAQWMQPASIGNFPPYMQDIFGHLSWESLFQDGGFQDGLWPEGFTEM